MEQGRVDTKLLFKNYLRNLYCEVSPKDVATIKSRLMHLQRNESWCLVHPDYDFIRKMLCYYLISSGCPEYLDTTSIDIVNQRFMEDGEDPVRYFIGYHGILIIRHSSNFIRNKLMLETMLNIASERSYKNRITIITSDRASDAGEYIYYNHDQIRKFIKTDLSAVRQSPIIHKQGLTVAPTQSKTGASMRRNQQAKLTNRSNMIEEKTKQCNTD